VSRGTTLVRPAVARPALKTSNKAAAGNGARRSALLEKTVQADCSGTSIVQRSARRLAPTAGSL